MALFCTLWFLCLCFFFHSLLAHTHNCVEFLSFATKSMMRTELVYEECTDKLKKKITHNAKPNQMIQNNFGTRYKNTKYGNLSIQLSFLCCCHSGRLKRKTLCFFTLRQCKIAFDSIQLFPHFTFGN